MQVIGEQDNNPSEGPSMGPSLQLAVGSGDTTEWWSPISSLLLIERTQM